MGGNQSVKVGDSSQQQNGQQQAAVKKKKRKRLHNYGGRMTSEFRDIERMRNDYMAKGRMNSDEEEDDDGVGETLGTEADHGEKSRRPVNFDLLQEARHILDMVVKTYGSGDAYLEATYGPRITYMEATERLLKYLYENNLDGAVTVIWSKKLACSALMVARGHSKKPENRKYVLYIKDCEDNPYLREQGIYCLINHEVFTHYVRFFNDGLQAWGPNRKRFDLKPLTSNEFADTEEGLAVLHSMLAANDRYLYLPALSYYTACMATKMCFDDLYRHLVDFIVSPAVRWKYAMRATAVSSRAANYRGYGPAQYAANAKDQCYFMGAVEILRQMNIIDFRLLISGKIALSDLSRIQRIARLDVIRLPEFLKSEELYRGRLGEIAFANNLVDKPPPCLTTTKLALRKASLPSTIKHSAPFNGNGTTNNQPRPFSTSSSSQNQDSQLRRLKSDFQIVLQHSIEPAPKDLKQNKHAAAADNDNSDGASVTSSLSYDEPSERIVRTWKQAIPTSMPSLPGEISMMTAPSTPAALLAEVTPRNATATAPLQPITNNNNVDSKPLSRKAMLKKLTQNPVNSKRFRSKVVFGNLSSATN